MADTSGAFVAEYSTCRDLRDQSLRFTKLQYGSTNIAENGHPQNSGAIDRRTLCVFRPRDAACLAPATAADRARTSSLNQRAVRQQTVNQQLNGSFRSVERSCQERMAKNTRLQQARCAQLLNNGMQ